MSKILCLFFLLSTFSLYASEPVAIVTYDQYSQEDFNESLEQFLNEQGEGYQASFLENEDLGAINVENSETSFTYEYSVEENAQGEVEVTIYSVTGDLEASQLLDEEFILPYQNESGGVVYQPN